MQRYVFGGILLLLIALFPGRARADGTLVRSEPAAGSVLPEAPATARLTFVEPPEPLYSRVVLAKADGPLIQTPASQIAPDDPFVLLLDLPELRPGQYQLAWRTLSSADGHTASGVIPFAVGKPSAANVPVFVPLADPREVPPLPNVVFRWLTFLGLTLVVGSLFFNWLIWRPELVPAEATRGLRRASRRLELSMTALSVVATLGMLVVTSAEANTTVGTFISTSRPGVLLALRLFIVLALLGVLWRARAHRRLLGVSVGFVALLSLSLLSHSAAPQNLHSSQPRIGGAPLAVVFDLLHLLATATWIGALPALLLGLLALRQAQPADQGRAATLIVARFTGFATAAVIILAATGTYTAYEHIGTVSDLWTTTYGRVLAVKVLLFAVLLLFGAYNRWRVQPGLATPPVIDGVPASATRKLRRLRWSVALEVMVSVVVLLVVGILTATTPSFATVPDVGYAATRHIGARTLTIWIIRDPNAGDTFAVYLRGLTEGARPKVVIRTQPVDGSAPQQELALRERRLGHWSERAWLLVPPGQWTVEVIMRTSGLDDVHASFAVDTSTLGQRPPRAAQPLWSLLFVGALLLAALSQLPIHLRWQARLRRASLFFIGAAFVVGVISFSSTRAATTGSTFQATPRTLAGSYKLADSYKGQAVAHAVWLPRRRSG